MELLYTALLYIIQPLVWLRLLLRSRKAPAYRKRWAERYGYCRNKVVPDGILLHSVSVGETLAAIPLVRALRHRYPSLPITVTTMTPTGSERALSAFGKDVQHVYLPYDLPCAMNRFLNTVRPKLVIVMETELWPNMISALHARKIPLVIANARAGKPLPIYGDGQQVRDWLYVGDHCAAIRRVLEGGRPGETYNIGGWNEKANIDVVHTLCDILDQEQPRADGRSYREQITFVKDRPGHDRRYAIDATRLERELGWKPAETFETGIRKTVRWYLDNQAWVNNVTSGAYREWVGKQYA